MRLISSTLVAAAVLAAFVAGRGTSTLSPQAAVAQPAPDGQMLSHFKCYQTSVKLDKPAAVYLRDQFGEEKMQLSFADLFCAPVLKRPIDFKPLPVPGPADHLLCYRGEDRPVNQVRAFANQLQRGRIQIGAPRYLCVPTWKQHIVPKQ